MKENDPQGPSDEIVDLYDYNISIKGEPWELEDKTQGWVWNKIQTKKSCFSIFTGDCGPRFPDK